MQTSFPQNTASHTPSGVSVLVEEITSLVEKVNAVDTRFLEVRRILVKTPFDPDDEFAQYRKKYLELVWKSREIAGKAGIAGEDFCGDLLDLLLLNTNVTKEEKIRELEIAMESWRTDSERDSQLPHSFKELSDTLKVFCTAFPERLARACEAEAKLRSDIDRLGAEIARIDTRQPVSDQLSLAISGAYRQARHSCQRIGVIPTLFVAMNMFTSVAFGVIWKSFTTVNAVLRSTLRGSVGVTLGALFSMMSEVVNKAQRLRHFLEASGGQHATSKENLRSQMSVLEENLRDILEIDRRADILDGVHAIIADIDSLSIRVACLSDIFNLMTAECVELLTVMRSDTRIEDLSAQVVALRKELSPIRKALAAYARAQKS